MSKEVKKIEEGATICPHCKVESTLVIMTRKSTVFGTVTKRRRRVCVLCEKRFSTYEITEEIYKKVKNALKILDKLGITC